MWRYWDRRRWSFHCLHNTALPQKQHWSLSMGFKVPLHTYEMPCVIRTMKEVCWEWQMVADFSPGWERHKEAGRDEEDQNDGTNPFLLLEKWLVWEELGRHSKPSVEASVLGAMTSLPRVIPNVTMSWHYNITSFFASQEEELAKIKQSCCLLNSFSVWSCWWYPKRKGMERMVRLWDAAAANIS